MSSAMELLEELKKTNKLLAILVLRGFENKTEQILLLSQAGFMPGEIASMVGTTSNTVSVTVARSKKKKEQK